MYWNAHSIQQPQGRAWRHGEADRQTAELRGRASDLCAGDRRDGRDGHFVSPQPAGTRRRGLAMELYVPTRPHNRWRHRADRSEEHTSALQSLMRTSYDVFCWKKIIYIY